jgi:hypothetical protein
MGVQNLAQAQVPGAVDADRGQQSGAAGGGP